jgi:hypothetical protein
MDGFTGGWLYTGKPCAIFQEGDIFLCVNEDGKIGTARKISDTQLMIFPGTAWGGPPNFTGTLMNGLLIWSNGTFWSRPA